MALSQSPISVGGLVTLNSVDASGNIWRVNQDGLNGWGEPASTLAPVQKPRQAGAWAGDAFNMARIISINGTITSLTPALLNDAIDLLKTAVTNAGFVLTVTETNRSRWVNARKQGETITQKVTNLHARYSVQVVAIDPRQFGTAVTGSTFLPVTTGGLLVPLTVPFIIGSTVVSGQIPLVNPGNAVGAVILRIDGPTTGPIVTHSGTGIPLVFSSSLVLGAGEWLTVDMEKRTAMANDQASRNGYITSRGWSGFDPGPNVWSFTASAYNAASMLTVTATPAWK